MLHLRGAICNEEEKRIYRLDTQVNERCRRYVRVFLSLSLTLEVPINPEVEKRVPCYVRDAFSQKSNRRICKAEILNHPSLSAIYAEGRDSTNVEFWRKGDSDNCDLHCFCIFLCQKLENRDDTWSSLFLSYITHTLRVLRWHMISLFLSLSPLETRESGWQVICTGFV